jgi:hypothetical protein
LAKAQQESAARFRVALALLAVDDPLGVILRGMCGLTSRQRPLRYTLT